MPLGSHIQGRSPEYEKEYKPRWMFVHSKLNRDDFDLVSDLASDLIKLCILKPAAKAKYRAEEVSAFLGDHPPLSPPRPTKNGGAILINLAKSDTIS